MKIHQIEIINFKGFEKKIFTLNDHFTVFVGENASGKTSVLDALAIALGGFFVEMPGLNSRPIKDTEIRVVDIDGQPKPQKPVKIQATGTANGNEITWKREIVNQKVTSKDAKPISKLARAMLDRSRKQSGVVFPVIAYHGTGRLWAEHEKIGFQKQEEGVKMAYINCLSPKSSSKEFLEWIKTQENSVEKFSQPLDIAHLKAMKNTILNLIPDHRWEELYFDRKREELAGLFTDAIGTKHILSFQQLSDGFRNIIGLAADIAYRCIQLNPHLGERAVTETPGIVLIDELDLHLHPNWQRRLVGDLKRVFPNIQFVATTHSPFIVQSLMKTEIRNLDEELERLEKNAYNYGIEDVAEIEMGVESVPRSEPFKERARIAADYFRLISEGKTCESDESVANLRTKLNQMEERFSDDLEFVTMLKLERETTAL